MLKSQKKPQISTSNNCAYQNVPQFRKNKQKIRLRWDVHHDRLRPVTQRINIFCIPSSYQGSQNFVQIRKSLYWIIKHYNI